MTRSGIKDPHGMFGETLSLDLGVVTVEPPHLKNLALAVERAHLSVAGFVMSPYAAARSVLAEDEKTLGVTVVDMGGATTSFAVFQDNHLVLADVVPIGGQHITNDIARGLSTTIAHAERMKTLWGSALASAVDEREMISVPLLGERGVDTVQQVPKSMLTGIIRPRLEETFEMLRAKLEALRGAAPRAAAAWSITGGASQLNGVREVATQWLDTPGAHGLARPCPGHAGKRPFAGLCRLRGPSQLCAEARHALRPAQGQGGGDGARPVGLCLAHGPLDRRELLTLRKPRDLHGPGHALYALAPC